MRTWPALKIHQADDDDLIQAFLIDFNLAAIDDSRYFFVSSDDRDRAAVALRTQFPNIDLQPVDVPDEDWATRSQAALRAVTVGALTIAPPWEISVGSGFSRTIVIEPSMGFGTGHHATTRLCLDALQRIDVRGRSVIDVGTGSGILAIAASRLGAEEVTGIDDDADAVQAAWDNLSLNASAQVTLIVGDSRSADLVPADVILANLTGGLLIEMAKRLRQLTNAHGRLVLSGFTTQEEAEVVTAYGAFSVEHRGEEEGWVCVTLRE